MKPKYYPIFPHYKNFNQSLIKSIICSILDHKWTINETYHPTIFDDDVLLRDKELLMKYCDLECSRCGLEYCCGDLFLYTDEELKE